MPVTEKDSPAARPGRGSVMDKPRFIAELAKQRAYCQGRSRLYHEVLLALEADAAVSPAWLSRVVDVWRTRRFIAGWEAVHLLLANMHRWALHGEAEELARVYPSCGGFRDGAGDAAVRFLRRAPSPFWNWLGSSRLQTNEAGRGVAWMLPAAAAFVPRGLPFHLVELGASAGLGLVADMLSLPCRFVAEPGCPPGLPPRQGQLSHAVLSRTGLDVHPLRLARPRDLLWLKACVWADDAARLARLDRAAGQFLELEAARMAPRVRRCDFAAAPGWLSAKLPAAADEGLLVFNASAAAFLGDEEYAALRRGMARALAPWGDRALWVECERPRGAEAGPHELTVHRARDGRLESRRLAVMDPRPREVRLLRGWNLL